MDRRQFGIALAGLGMQVIGSETVTHSRPVSLSNDLLPHLRRFAKLPWPQCVEGAMPVLSPLGDFIPLLVEALEGGDPDMRLLAIDLLAEVESDQRSLPALVAALDDPDEIVRIYAVEPVLRFGTTARAALPALRSWLSGEASTPSRQEWFRLTAAAALVRIDPDQIQEMLPMLVEALESQNPLCHVVAAEALGDIGKAAAVALPRLEELAQEESESTWFAEAIEKITAATDLRHLPGNRSQFSQI